MKCRILALCLAGFALFAPLSAWSEPLAPSPSVTLSPEEYAQIVAAMESARDSLKQSNEIIKSQSQNLTRLWIFCAVLGTALVIDAAAEIIEAVKR